MPVFQAGHDLGMRALVVHPGTADSLELVEMPEPAPADKPVPVGSTRLLCTDELTESRVYGRRQDLDDSLNRLIQLVAGLPAVTGPVLYEHVVGELVDFGHDDDIALPARQVVPQDPR